MPRKTHGKATAAKVTSVAKKTKKTASSQVEKKLSSKSTKQHQQIAPANDGANEFFQRAQEAYEREQERIRANAKTFKKRQKEMLDRRQQDWLKNNPGKTKYQYQKFQKERLEKQIAIVKAQSRFLQMKRLSQRTIRK